MPFLILATILFLPNFALLSFSHALGTTHGHNERCVHYAIKATACYNLGHLADSYDHTGIPCGKENLELSIWDMHANDQTENPWYVHASDDWKTFTSKEGITTTDCFVEITNRITGKEAAFNMTVVTDDKSPIGSVDYKKSIVIEN